MGISSSVSRLTSFYTRHGLGATIRRARLAVERTLFSSHMVLFYCDLATQAIASANIPTPLKLERLKSYAEVSAQDLQGMTSFWNAKQANRNIRDRFDQGASLWLIKSGGNLAGYGWTLQGRTIEPHYLPLAQSDVHLFDFHVFPQFRGQGMNPILVTNILGTLAGECRGRAFIEAAEWNQAQLSSLGKTPFRHLGLARKSRILRRPIVCWAKNETLDQMQKEMDQVNRSIAMAKPHEH